MKVTKKLRKQILDAVADGILKTYEQNIDNYFERAPELWQDDEKHSHSVITDAEKNVTTELDSLLLPLIR